MNVDKEFVGKKIRCPNCKSTFPINEYAGEMTASIPRDAEKEDITEQKSTGPFSSDAQNEEMFEEVSEEFQEFETKEDAKAPSFAASQYETYDQPKLGVFKNIVPANMKIVG
ncbi:MAG: hypothetical protein K8S87_11825, partial [Planctomycetes bacterium]|nr:hypothetical protein [Planctomycetota bacterium]